MSPARPTASIIVPTYREVDNLRPLVTRTFAALTRAGIEAEMILVDDDSRDGTIQAVEALSAEFAVRLIERRTERGLSSAVLAGFAEARFDRFVVMDADLQHPPEEVPALLERLDSGECDFVIGTRYGPGGGIDEDWPALRRLTSWVATLLARPLAPLSDPMSGFFALKRNTWSEAARLDPIGYKIALELYVKGGCRSPAEVPIRFATRVAGESKLSVAEQIRYLRHLARLYRFRFPRACSTLLAILFVTAALCVYISYPE